MDRENLIWYISANDPGGLCYDPAGSLAFAPFYQDTALIISRNGGLAYEGMY